MKDKSIPTIVTFGTTRIRAQMFIEDMPRKSARAVLRDTGPIRLLFRNKRITDLISPLWYKRDEFYVRIAGLPVKVICTRIQQDFNQRTDRYIKTLVDLVPIR